MVLIAHCLLNQNTVVAGWERAQGAFPVSELLVKSGVGILQMPCPEFLYGGLDRLPLDYEDYDTEPYRALCADIAEEMVKQIEAYTAHGVRFVGTIGIHNSPTCSISGKRGVLMEELFRKLRERGLETPYLEIPKQYTEEGEQSPMRQDMVRFLEGPVRQEEE